MATEKFTVAGNQVVEKVKQLIHEGNIRRVRILHEGRTLLEIPLSVGAPATAIVILAAPVLAALGAFAALVTECTIEVEKIEDSNRNDYMTEIILVRHGETEWNVGEIFRGRADVELSENGIKQAELLAEFLGNEKIDAVYSSSMKRALNTAKVIAHHHNLDVEITSGLMEIDFGRWQGMSRQEVIERYPELYKEWTTRPDRVTLPGGESLNDVRERVTIFINEVVARYEGTVVLVAHRVVNKVLICTLLGLDNSHFWNIRQDTCGITSFSYENGRFILVRHNDTSYLKYLTKATLTDF